MADKRFGKRCRKRLKVRFGKTDPIHVAFTEDLSDTGLFLHTAFIYPPQTPLHFEMAASDGAHIHLEGIVMWAKKLPPSVIHKLKGGMGIRITRFVAGKEAFFRLQESTVSATKPSAPL